MDGHLTIKIIKLRIALHSQLKFQSGIFFDEIAHKISQFTVTVFSQIIARYRTRRAIAHITIFLIIIS